MPVEAGTVISNLDQTWPLSQDGVSEGDNHLRLIKKILQSQFPGAGGAGFAKVITSSEDELNRVKGATSNIQEQLDAIGVQISDIVDWQASAMGALYAPVGTFLIFGEAKIPPGWTVENYGPVSNLVIIDPDVSTSPGWQGGSDDPTRLHWSHRHSLPVSTTQVSIGSGVRIAGDDLTTTEGGTWQPRYIEAVVAKKD